MGSERWGQVEEKPQQPQMLLTAVHIALCTVGPERGQFDLLPA